MFFGNRKQDILKEKHTAINNSAASECWDTQVHAHARARSCNDILTMFEQTGRKLETDWGIMGSAVKDRLSRDGEPAPDCWWWTGDKSQVLKRAAAAGARWDCSLLADLVSRHAAFRVR